MADTAVKQEAKKATKIMNIRNVTTIPNSIAEHTIYTYSTSVDTTADIKTKGFFNPGFSFLEVGDVIRVFNYDNKKELVKYFEFVVMAVDKDVREVTVAIMAERNLKDKIIV